jgi:hypothetical protein
MDEKRQGEIAVILFRRHLRMEGVKLSREMHRNFASISKETGILIEELKEFTKPFIEEFLKDLFEHKGGGH